MEHTISLKLNHEFRRLYSKGKSAVTPNVVVYCRKNRCGHNRLGFTVGVKVGNAVIRNRTRRRLRECYRIHESEIANGYDIVVVARVRSPFASYKMLERDLLRCLGTLQLVKGKESDSMKEGE